MSEKVAEGREKAFCNGTSKYEAGGRVTLAVDESGLAGTDMCSSPALELTDGSSKLVWIRAFVGAASDIIDPYSLADAAARSDTLSVALDALNKMQ